jgi:hypothetical protein
MALRAIIILGAAAFPETEREWPRNFVLLLESDRGIPFRFAVIRVPIRTWKLKTNFST